MSIEVDFTVEENRIGIRATVDITARTGIEMEALTAVSVAALTLYDMCKGVDKGMVIEGIRLSKNENHENAAPRPDAPSSDRASAGIYEDPSGPEIETTLSARFLPQEINDRHRVLLA